MSVRVRSKGSGSRGCHWNHFCQVPANPGSRNRRPSWPLLRHRGFSRWSRYSGMALWKVRFIVFIFYAPSSIFFIDWFFQFTRAVNGFPSCYRERRLLFWAARWSLLLKGERSDLQTVFERNEMKTVGGGLSTLLDKKIYQKCVSFTLLVNASSGVLRESFTERCPLKSGTTSRLTLNFSPLQQRCRLWVEFELRFFARVHRQWGYRLYTTNFERTRWKESSLYITPFDRSLEETVIRHNAGTMRCRSSAAIENEYQ